MQTAWVDGKIVPWHQATVHISTHALSYATCAIEGIRVYNGHAFLLEEHMKRLIESAHTLSIKIPYTIAELIQATNNLIKKARLKNGYLRPLAWLGDETLELNAKTLSSHTAIIALPVDETFGLRHHARGLRVMISSFSRPAPYTSPSLVKTAATYPLSIMARHEAERNGYNDCLLLDYRGYLAEGTGANIFLVIDGKLHTPIPDSFLNGLTRQTVIKLARKNNIDVVERAIQPDELKIAEEIFLTGTAYEIMPVREIKDFGIYSKDAVTNKLQKAFTALTQNFYL